MKYMLKKLHFFTGILLFFSATAVHAQDGTPTATAPDMTFILAILLVIAGVMLVVERSRQNQPSEPANKDDIKKRRTQELVAASDYNSEPLPPSVTGGGGGGGDSDDMSVLILILLESPSNWLKAPYQWEILPEDTPFYIGSTMNRTSSMDLDIGIPDERVSGNHIRIDYNADVGRFTFTDMNSFNGSEWDSDVMTPDHPYILQIGHKNSLIVSHYYKFRVSTMSRPKLENLAHDDALLPMFLGDTDVAKTIDGESNEDTVINTQDTSVHTKALPPLEEVTQNLGSFDFDVSRYRSSVTDDADDPLADVLPEPTPLPKNIEAYLIWHENEKDDTKLTSTVLTIGSGEDADIKLKSEEISDTHLILTWQDGEFLLKDVSHNGTWLQKGRRQQRVRMPKNQPERLQAGLPYVLHVARDIGNFTLRYNEIADARDAPTEIASLPEGITPYLHIVREDVNNHRREVTELGSNITLGRYMDSKVLLVAETISRSHAQIVWNDDGFAIRDVNSRGGTKVNDTLLIENDSTWLPLEPEEIHRIILSPGQKEVLVEFFYHDTREKAVT